MKIKNLKVFKGLRKIRLDGMYHLYMLTHKNTFYLTGDNFDVDESVKTLEKKNFTSNFVVRR